MITKVATYAAFRFYEEGLGVVWSYDHIDKNKKKPLIDR
jgi:hypothetical protein